VSLRVTIISINPTTEGAHHKIGDESKSKKVRGPSTNTWTAGGVGGVGHVSKRQKITAFMQGINTTCTVDGSAAASSDGNTSKMVKGPWTAGIDAGARAGAGVSGGSAHKKVKGPWAAGIGKGRPTSTLNAPTPTAKAALNKKRKSKAGIDPLLPRAAAAAAATGSRAGVVGAWDGGAGAGSVVVIRGGMSKAERKRAKKHNAKLMQG
jgi:hypothetical protein